MTTCLVRQIGYTHHNAWSTHNTDGNTPTLLCCIVNICMNLNIYISIINKGVNCLSNMIFCSFQLRYWVWQNPFHSDWIDDNPATCGTRIGAITVSKCDHWLACMAPRWATVATRSLVLASDWMLRQARLFQRKELLRFSILVNKFLFVAMYLIIHV